MTNVYRRTRDQAVVDASEALDGAGGIRSGYSLSSMIGPGDHIGFDMAFMDSAGGGNRVFLRDAMLTDAETAFRDSPEGREAIAFAKSCAALRQHANGNRPWTDADERVAIQGAMIARDHHRKKAAEYAAGIPALQAANDAALRQIRDGFRDSRNH